MNKNSIKLIVLVVELIAVFVLTTVVSTVFYSCIRNISTRELAYNPAMPILSRIVVGEAGFNFKEILSFLGLEFLIFSLPKIGFRITCNPKESAYLCLMPVVMWGIMAVFSYQTSKVNNEVPLFIIAAFLQTVVSVVLYIRYLDRYFCCEDEY